MKNTRRFYIALFFILVSASLLACNSSVPQESSKVKPKYSFDKSEASKLEGLSLLNSLSEVCKLTWDCTNPDSKDYCRFFKSQIVQRSTEYQQYILTGLQAVQGKKVDFILYFHPTKESIAGDRNLNATIAQSSKMVIQTIEQIHPELIGIEGCYDERCDQQSEIDDTKRVYQDLKMKMPDESLIQRAVAEAYGNNWHSQYRRLHPEARFAGVDDYAIHTTDSMVSELLSGYRDSDDGIIDLLWHTRSVYALARMGHLLRDKDLNSGVIVMGYWHGADFKSLAQSLGLESRIFVAISPEAITRYQLKQF